jgi:hypothetical protein
MAVALSLMACDTSGNGGRDDEVTFLDRTLQGTFNGKSFTFVSGYAEDSYSQPGFYDLKLYNVNPNDGNMPWDLFAYPSTNYLKVMATVSATTGRTDLFFNLETGANKTVIFFDSIGSYNIHAHVGSVEISSIDLVAGTVTGHIAASDEDGNEVNGRFTVPIAP